MSADITKAAHLLCQWYPDHARDLPWRRTQDPYRIWVSEIMLQQTRVEAVKGYYERFLKELPAIEDLAACPEEKLLKLWEGLGYYNRVRNMQKAARVMVSTYGGRFPQTYEEILALPGIGSYTAGAVSSFAFHLPYPAVDGNVLRVLTRLRNWEADILKASVKKEAEEILSAHMPQDPAVFNQAMMELGATVCVPNGMPKCEQCPLQDLCEAKKQGTMLMLPVKTPKKARRIEKKTVLLITDRMQVLIRKRPQEGLLASLNEFPNVQGYLTEEEALALVSDLGLSPIRIQKLPQAKHIFTHIEWHMQGYRILVEEMEEKFADTASGVFAVGRQQLDEVYAIPSAFRAYLDIAKQDTE